MGVYKLFIYNAGAFCMTLGLLNMIFTISAQVSLYGLDVYMWNPAIAVEVYDLSEYGSGNCVVMIIFEYKIHSNPRAFHLMLISSKESMEGMSHFVTALYLSVKQCTIS